MSLLRSNLHRPRSRNSSAAAAGKPSRQRSRCFPQLERISTGNPPNAAAADRTAGIQVAAAMQYRALLLPIIKVKLFSLFNRTKTQSRRAANHDFHGQLNKFNNTP